MSWEGLAPMAKFEVVIDGDQVPAVRDLFIEAGATGYTGLGRLRGSVTTATTRAGCCSTAVPCPSLITVVPEDKVPSLVTGLRRLLEDRHGVFFVTQTHGSRAHYFR
jgi:hypothetical protein